MLRIFEQTPEIMTTTTTRTQDFSTAQTTPLVRMNALIMAIMHIPTLIAGFIGVLMSIIAWPILPVTIIAFFMGTSLYARYWQMYRDTITRDKAQKIWEQTYYFNIVLLIPAIWANVAIGLSVGWFIVGFIVTSIFLAKTALNDMKS